LKTATSSAYRHFSKDMPKNPAPLKTVLQGVLVPAVSDYSFIRSSDYKTRSSATTKITHTAHHKPYNAKN